MTGILSRGPAGGAHGRRSPTHAPREAGWRSKADAAHGVFWHPRAHSHRTIPQGAHETRRTRPAVGPSSATERLRRRAKDEGRFRAGTRPSGGRRDVGAPTGAPGAPGIVGDGAVHVIDVSEARREEDGGQANARLGFPQADDAGRSPRAARTRPGKHPTIGGDACFDAMDPSRTGVLGRDAMVEDVIDHAATGGVSSHLLDPETGEGLVPKFNHDDDRRGCRRALGGRADGHAHAGVRLDITPATITVERRRPHGGSGHAGVGGLVAARSDRGRAGDHDLRGAPRAEATVSAQRGVRGFVIAAPRAPRGLGPPRRAASPRWPCRRARGFRSAGPVRGWRAGLRAL